MLLLRNKEITNLEKTKMIKKKNEPESDVHEKINKTNDNEFKTTNEFVLENNKNFNTGDENEIKTKQRKLFKTPDEMDQKKNNHLQKNKTINEAVNSKKSNQNNQKY